MNTKQLVKRKNKDGKNIYNYLTTAFNRVGFDGDGNIINARSNRYRINLRLAEHTIAELNYFIRRGGKEFEIRKNEIYLRDAHVQHVSSEMARLFSEFENENNTETFENKDWLDTQINILNEYCSEQFFIKYYGDLELFKHDFKDDIEVCVKYIYEGENYPDGKLLIQLIKTFKKDNRKNVFLHKFKPKLLKQFKDLVS